MKVNPINSKIEAACKRIAPAWPLESSVAVNPYLGLSDQPFHKAAKLMDERGNIQLYMPFEFYLKAIEEEDIIGLDLRSALEKNGASTNIEAFLAKVDHLVGMEVQKKKVLKVLDLVKKETKPQSVQAMLDHFSVWFATYFHQNHTGERPSEQLFQTWKLEAEVDLFPELNGFEGFRKHIKKVPNNADAAILKALDALEISDTLLEMYLHSVLLELVGWSSFCAGLDWQNNLYGGDQGYVKSMLAIMLTWESFLLGFSEQTSHLWKKAKDNNQSISTDEFESDVLQAKHILQEAYDMAYQRKLRGKFLAKKQAGTISHARALAQMVFCIDVRSEVYRRSLEEVNPQIETFGFAGFFGFPVKYAPLNHQSGRHQCPVLIPSGPEVQETTANVEDFEKEKNKRVVSGKLSNAWSKFKSGSGSSFGFVSPLGIFYLPKLISDAFGWSKPIASPKEKEFGSLLSGKGKLDLSAIPFENQVTMARNALVAMGITKDFAPFVLLSGHGASSVNNPHASGLDCGACGGNSGEVNALTAQIILNDPKIRAELKKFNLEIPTDTVFVACVHNTTTDEITIIDKPEMDAQALEQFEKIKVSLIAASSEARKKRSVRFGIEQEQAETELLKRANDWSQVRPEWGLAGCAAFIIAPRARTRGIDLEGKAFLHSYDWKADGGFKVLESIMTAPMIVTSWINLQYYASTVDNQKLGAGNKTLHNVTGGFGVLEGAKGDLRIGLPIQSVHDGENYQHLPIRLNVVIEAPKEAVNQILEKHPNVKELLDNNWISLLLLDEQGSVCHQYSGDLNWMALEEKVPTSKSKQKRILETI